MLNGSYCRLAGKKPEENIYIAFNMHWESRKLGVPTAGRNKKWKLDITTAEDIQDLSGEEPDNHRYLTVPPRSVVVLSSVTDPEAEERERLLTERLKKQAEEAAKAATENQNEKSRKTMKKKGKKEN